MTSAATWGGIAAIVITATTGDVLQARAMKEIGNLGVIRKTHGVLEVVRRILNSPWFMAGLFFMALAFFSLLVTLSWDDVSIVGLASASLTFTANALAARLFLKERVVHRRWLGALFVACGVALLAH